MNLVVFRETEDSQFSLSYLSEALEHQLRGNFLSHELLSAMRMIGKNLVFGLEGTEVWLSLGGFKGLLGKVKEIDDQIIIRAF